MNGLEGKLNQYISERGVMISVISSKTGIPDAALYGSLRGNRRLRADELLLVCNFLQINPMAFFCQQSQQTGA